MFKFLRPFGRDSKLVTGLDKQKLRDFSPLRYPGGKGKLSSFVKELLERHELTDGEYAEPYCGGAGIALELLLQDYVSHVRLNDASLHIYSFWQALLRDTDAFLRLLRETPLTVDAWDTQRRIFTSSSEHTPLEVGFATFFLNRTNRSGILNGGMIGGRSQDGDWKLDARFNRAELAHRITAIAERRDRITVTRVDAADFIRTVMPSLPARSLVYLDPPYFVKGKDLYHHYYAPEDHAMIAELLQRTAFRCRWLVSYDNVPEIRDLYRNFEGISYSLGYSARTARVGTEVMYFSPGLTSARPASVMRSVQPIQRVDGGKGFGARRTRTEKGAARVVST